MVVAMGAHQAMALPWLDVNLMLWAAAAFFSLPLVAGNLSNSVFELMFLIFWTMLFLLAAFFFFPPDRKGLLDFMLESAFAMLLHHAPTQHPASEYPARVARQWIPPNIPPE